MGAFHRSFTIITPLRTVYNSRVAPTVRLARLGVKQCADLAHVGLVEAQDAYSIDSDV
jgi:hypothetical protein